MTRPDKHAARFGKANTHLAWQSVEITPTAQQADNLRDLVLAMGGVRTLWDIFRFLDAGKGRHFAYPDTWPTARPEARPEPGLYRVRRQP